MTSRRRKLADQPATDQASTADAEIASIEAHMEGRDDASFDPANLESQPIHPQQPPELIDRPADQIVQSVADSTRIDTSHHNGHEEPLAGREWTKFADPNPRHSVHWEDGYTIRLQESGSRKTIEIQFGDGSREDMPKNMLAIREKLKAAGMKWNKECAWEKELVPETGSQRNRLMAREENRAIRARVEDVVFPQIIKLEEELRGELPFAEETRERINKAAAGRG